MGKMCVYTANGVGWVAGLILPPLPSPLPLSLPLPSSTVGPICMLQVVDLEVDESSFTGETIPSRKSTLPQVRMCIQQGLKAKANIYTKTPRTSLFPKKIRAALGEIQTHDTRRAFYQLSYVPTQQVGVQIFNTGHCIVEPQNQRPWDHEKMQRSPLFGDYRKYSRGLKQASSFIERCPLFRVYSH